MINIIEDFASRQVGFGRLSVTRRVTGAPAYQNGYPTVDAPVTTTAIIAQVAPVDGRGLKLLADQSITSESVMLLTRFKLCSRTKTTEPDQLVGYDLDDGDLATWTVFNVMKYTAPDRDVFYKIIVTRDDPE